jgi:hypothetical protein
MAAALPWSRRLRKLRFHRVSTSRRAPITMRGDAPMARRLSIVARGFPAPGSRPDASPGPGRPTRGPGRLRGTSCTNGRRLPVGPTTRDHGHAPTGPLFVRAKRDYIFHEVSSGRTLSTRDEAPEVLRGLACRGAD